MPRCTGTSTTSNARSAPTSSGVACGRSWRSGTRWTRRTSRRRCATTRSSGASPTRSCTRRACRRSPRRARVSSGPSIPTRCDVGRGADRDVSIGGPTLAAQRSPPVSSTTSTSSSTRSSSAAGSAPCPTASSLDLELVDEHRFASGVVHLHHLVAPPYAGAGLQARITRSESPSWCRARLHGASARRCGREGRTVGVAVWSGDEADTARRTPGPLRIVDGPGLDRPRHAVDDSAPRAPEYVPGGGWQVGKQAWFRLEDGPLTVTGRQVDGGSGTFHADIPPVNLSPHDSTPTSVRVSSRRTWSSRPAGAGR